MSVVPNTTVVFEVAVRNHSGDYSKRLWVDGNEVQAEPDIFYGQLDRGDRDVVTLRFDEAGRHRVRLELRDGGSAFGSVEWTVRVADDGNRPPTAERVRPQAKVLAVPSNGPQRTFRLRVADRDGNLDRVVWWANQCDEVVGVSSVSGSRDVASVTYQPDGGCPLRPAVIDDQGALRWDDGWIIRRGDAPGHYIRIRSDGGGVATYEFVAGGSVRQIDDGDEVRDDRGSGHVGPKRGEDLFYFEGDLQRLTVDGPATVWVDGQTVDPANYGGGGGSGGSTHVVKVVSDGGGMARYRIRVSGQIRQRDSGDSAHGHVATGHVGPKRGTDVFEFGGEIEQLHLDGPATVYVDGRKVRSGGSAQNTLKIRSDGGGLASYRFTVSGTVRQVDSGDEVHGDRASGHVGPKRGTDTFRYTGDITGFDLDGPATVFRNGTKVNPSTLE